VTFTEDSAVRQVVSQDDHVEVHTDCEVFHCSSLTACAGSWTSTAVGGLDVDLPNTMPQQQVTYFATPHPGVFAPDRFPIWIFHGPGRPSTASLSTVGRGEGGPRHVGYVRHPGDQKLGARFCMA
jgi:glycine/D-amino acid oxidase-like deaminating enzyme